MLKKTITYTDFNDEERTEDLYFNLSKTEMLDLQNLQPRLEAWRNSVSGDPRDLTVDEIAELLSIIKLLIEKSYGIRSEDGRRFRKSPSIFAEFQETAAYDAFVMSLFENSGQGAVDFLMGIVPKDLRTEMNRNTVDVQLPTGGELNHDDTPAWIKEKREPTQAELAVMTPEQLREAFRVKSQA